MSSSELFIWVRGSGFDYAMIIMVFGIVIRLFEIFFLGRAKPLYEMKGPEASSGMRRIFSLFVIHQGEKAVAFYSALSAYIFHIGLFIVVFLFVPHIMIFKDIFGLSWPGLPNSFINAVTVITLFALVIRLYLRFTDPAQKQISVFSDYFVWFLTFLPVLTGYMTYHKLMLDYQTMLTLHILSVELLMVFLPFTKLMHSFTVFISRWYNGAIAGSKGVQL